MKTRKDFPSWHTEIQWNEKGYVVKKGHDGQTLWTNRTCRQQTKYYSPADVSKNAKKAEELNKKRQKEYQENGRIKKQKIEKEIIRRENWHTEYQWKQLGREPNPNAVWKLGRYLNGYLFQFGENYAYCHIDDTHEIKENNQN